MTLKWPNAIAALTVCSGVAVATLSRTASACSGAECAPDQFVPRAGSVPANLPGIAWWAGDTWNDGDGGRVISTTGDLSLECSRDDGSRHAVALDFGETAGYPHVQPKTPLVSGERCSLWSRAIDCDASSAGDGDGIWGAHDTSYLRGKASFTVGDAAPLPAALGELVTQPATIQRLELPDSSGCTAYDEVCAVEGSIAFSDDAEPWKNVFVYEATVDGEPWKLKRVYPLPGERGGSYLGRGREIVFAKRPGARQGAPETKGVSVGRHTVVIRATVPGTDIALETPPAEINLDCFAVVDAGVTEPMDAGASPDAAMRHDAEVKPPSKAKRSSSSCAVANPGARGGMLAAMAFLGLALAFSRRRGVRG